MLRVYFYICEKYQNPYLAKRVGIFQIICQKYINISFFISHFSGVIQVETKKLFNQLMK